MSILIILIFSMKFYRINPTVNKEIVGQQPQIEKVISKIHVESPEYITKVGFKKIDSYVYVPDCVLAKNAKITDFITTSSLSHYNLLSKKLKDIIQASQPKGIQILPINLIIQDQTIQYWILHPYSFAMNYINFENSRIFLTKWGFRKIENISLNSLKEFTDKITELEIPNFLLIEKPVLHAMIKKDFFMLRWVEGGVGYFISERLKKQIEVAACTGIEFEHVDSA